MADYTHVRHLSPWTISGTITGREVLNYVAKARQNFADIWGVPIEKIEHSEIFWDGRYAMLIFYAK